MNRHDAPTKLPNKSPAQIAAKWIELEQNTVADCREKFGDEATDEWLANGGLAELRQRMFCRMTGIKPKP